MVTRIAAALAAIALVSGCREATAPAPPTVYVQPVHLPASFELSARLLPDSIARPVAWLTFTNRGAAPDTVIYGACSFAVLLYAGTTITTPAWQSVPTEPYACIDVAYLLPVAPGGSQTIGIATLARSFSIPAPPAGLHRAFVALDTGRIVLVRAGDVNLP